MPFSQQRLGLIFAGLCALNGALVPGVAKLLTARIDPFLLATLTTVCGAACACVLLAARGELGMLVRRDLALRLAALGALGTTAAYLFFFFGAQRASAIETVLVLQIEPAYALLFSWGVLGHRPTLRRVAAILVALVGILFAVGWEAAEWRDLSGPALLLLPPLCWQLSHLITLRGLVGVSPRVLAGARYIYGAVFLVVAWATIHGGTPVPQKEIAGAMPLLIFQGVVLYYGGTLLWYHAVTRLDLTRATAIVVPSIPILSFGASFVLLGETPTAAQVVGLVLAAGGVLVFVTSPRPFLGASAPPQAGAGGPGHRVEISDTDCRTR